MELYHDVWKSIIGLVTLRDVAALAQVNRRLSELCTHILDINREKVIRCRVHNKRCYKSKECGEKLLSAMNHISKERHHIIPFNMGSIDDTKPILLCGGVNLRMKKISNEKKLELAVGLGKCERCKSTCSNKCSDCHAVFYCSKKCQAKEWNSHKRICRSMHDIVHHVIH